MPRVSPNYVHPISHDVLKSILHYEPNTGVFTRIRPTNTRTKIGEIVGSHSGSDGYLRVSVGGRLYMGHVLAWLYMTGEYVVRGIDHKDTNRSNNAWSNLRKATFSQNCLNRSLRTDNALGMKGVYVDRSKSPSYRAQISIDGKQKCLGRFRTAEEAKAAYDAAAVKFHGEFARTL
jgi:HNH endonuclease